MHRFRSTILLLLSAFSSAFAAAVTFPDVSRSPSNASQILDRRLASFSFEFAYLPNFGGNLSSPNVLTRELMQRLEERTGVGPDIRPGGITMYALIRKCASVALPKTFTLTVVTALNSIQKHLLWILMRAQ